MSFKVLLHFRLIDHAKQLLEDKEETLCVRVLQTIKGMMARDIDFGDKVRFDKGIISRVLSKNYYYLFYHTVGLAMSIIYHIKICVGRG